MNYLANCSMLFTELPLLQRPAAAKAAGFDAVEFWWPWPDQPVPADADVDAFVDAIEDAGVQLVGLNFFAGDLAGPDCGVLSIPSRSREFRDNIDVAVGIGERLGVSAFNALYGNRVDDVDAAEQDELGRENLALAADAAAGIGADRPRRSGQRPEAVPAAHGRRRGRGGRGRPRSRAPQRRLPARPVPPRQQRRRRRRRDRQARRRHRPRADRRLPGPGRAGLRRPRPRPAARRAGRPRLRRLGRPGVQADHRHRDQPGVAAPCAAAPPRPGAPHDEHRLHRPRHHGQPDGRPPAERRARGQRLQQAARPQRPARRGRRPQGRLDRRRGRRRRRRRGHGPGLTRRAATSCSARTGSSPRPSRARWSSTSPASART